MSYSVYMTHFVILSTFETRFGRLDVWSVATFGLLAVTVVVVSIGAHFAIEVPARNAIRSKQRLRRAAA